MAQVHPLKSNISPFKGTFLFPKVEYLSSLEVEQLVHQFTQKVIQHSNNPRILRWGRYKTWWSILPLTPDCLTSLIQNHDGLATIPEDSNSSTKKKKDVLFSGFSLAKHMATPPKKNVHPHNYPPKSHENPHTFICAWRSVTCPFLGFRLKKMMGMGCS